MSAYLVGKTHIATLATYAAGGQRHVSQRFGSLVDIANLLAAANADSVNARYRTDDLPELFESSQEVWNAARLELHLPVVMLKACHCLEYQSCEFDGWVSSAARELLTQIESKAIRSLPGYDDAEGWSIDPAPANAPKVMSLYAMSQGAYRKSVRP